MTLPFQGVKCPVCDRKGLHYANHPHAFGHKDRTRVTCRFCHNRFPTYTFRDRIAAGGAAMSAYIDEPRSIPDDDALCECGHRHSEHAGYGEDCETCDREALCQNEWTGAICGHRRDQHDSYGCRGDLGGCNSPSPAHHHFTASLPCQQFTARPEKAETE